MASRGMAYGINFSAILERMGVTEMGTIG